MIDLAALRAFVGVARAGHVGRAATRLGRSQPSVSARLAGLESAWGTRLFRRHARGMSLTPEGARLLPLAEAAVRAAEALEEAAGAPLSGARELRLGAGDALGRELLPRTIARLLAQDPGLEVRLLEGPASRLAQALLAGEIDVALTVSAEAVPPGVTAAPLLDSRVDLLLPRGTAPSRPRALPPGFLEGRPLVLLHRGSAFRRHVEAALMQAGIQPVAAVEVGNLSLVRRFVAAGLGVALVPAIAFGVETGRASRVERRPVTAIPPVRYVRLVRAGAPVPEPARRFLEVLSKEAARPPG
jgi:LysR family hydrogen peroxide-inducible transcriptional activator